LAQGLSAVAARLEAKHAAIISAQAAAILVKGIEDLKDRKDPSTPFTQMSLAKGVSAVAGRLDARDATRAAAALVLAMDDKRPEILLSLAEPLSRLIARMNPENAATTTAQATTIFVRAMKDIQPNPLNPNSVYLSMGLKMLAPHMEARHAAQTASILIDIVKNTKDHSQLVLLADPLNTIASRMEAKDATTTFARAINDTNDPLLMATLVHCLADVGIQMNEEEAAAVMGKAFIVILKGLKGFADKKDQSDPLGSLPLYVLALGLSDVAVRIDPKEATSALVQTMKVTKEPTALGSLAESLSRVTTRMEPKDAIDALIGAIKGTKDADALSSLVQGLSAVAARIEPKDTPAVTALAAATAVQAMKDTKDARALASLAQRLSAVAARMEPRDASAVTAKAAATLVQAMKDTKDAHAMASLARGLTAVAARMEPKDAATVIEQGSSTVVQVMKETKKRYDSVSLAHALSALTAHMESKDPATTTSALAREALARGLVQVMHDSYREELSLALLSPVPPSEVAARSRATASALLSPVPPSEVAARSRATASAAAFLASGGDALSALANLISVAEMPPCPLSTQQLVDLLKTPPCVGASRRAILDQLGNRYRRTFADVWEFVRYSQEKSLNLDFTTPPQRP
jgi:hypothetical protein